MLSQVGGERRPTRDSSVNSAEIIILAIRTCNKLKSFVNNFWGEFPGLKSLSLYAEHAHQLLDRLVVYPSRQVIHQRIEPVNVLEFRAFV